MLQIIHGQSINTKSHDVIFETRSIWLKLNSGRTIPLSFRGQLGPGAFRPSPALVAPWTRAVSFSPRSISTKYSSAKSQKPRGILLKTLSTISKTSRLRLEVLSIVSRFLSPYTSRIKNHIMQIFLGLEKSDLRLKINCCQFSQAGHICDTARWLGVFNIRGE